MNYSLEEEGKRAPKFNQEKIVCHFRYGRVWRVKNKHTEEYFACKVILKEKIKPKSLQNLKDEISYMQQIIHPGCPKVKQLVSIPKHAYTRKPLNKTIQRCEFHYICSLVEIDILLNLKIVFVQIPNLEDIFR